MTKNNSEISSENRSGNKVGLENQIWNFFTSVKLTVVVLILLAATSIIGTFIPQNGAEELYIHKYGEFFFKFFSILDIFDMYNAWWFMLLLMLLSINIIICSIDKINTTWKIIFPDKVNFNIERFRHLKHKEVFVSGQNIESLEDKYLSFIEKSFGMALKEETDQGVAIFGEQGRWTRLGVYVVHLSVLCMLAGAVIGSIWGFKAFVAIPEGETVDTVFLRGNDVAVPLGFQIRCNSFNVLFYDTGHPEEFKSSITVIEDEKEAFTRDIIVNDPLRYKGLSFYQSSYGVDSAKSVVFKITSRESGMTYSQKMEAGQTIDIPESGGKFTLSGFVRGYNFQGHNLGEGFVGILTDKENLNKESSTQDNSKDDSSAKEDSAKEDSAKEDSAKEDSEKNHDQSDKALSEKDHDHFGKDHSEEDHKNDGITEIYIPVKFPTFDKMRRGAFAFEIQNYEKKYYTGLQVTKDPGVWYVYGGFIFMIIGCWITFFMSHQSICVEIKRRTSAGCDIVISGIANRNSHGMKLKVAKIAKKLSSIKSNQKIERV
ncbi:MAG: cytochrome c biogenesis protein ResB [Desulfamplus sp.]|nr:cytochrome c biogenesis protein ResB [Desulfamplus sp.]